MRRICAGLIVLWILAVFPAEAGAQLWLEDRQSREGPGLKLGDSLVLHLGLGVEGGYDTNVEYSNDSAGAGRLRLTPYVDLATRSDNRRVQDQPGASVAEPRATFRTGLAVSYDRYFADSTSADRFNSNLNPLGIDTHFNAVFLPKRKVSFLTGITYVKTMEPYETGADAQSTHELTPSFGMRVAPGGGTLVFEPRYRFNLRYFVDDSRADNSNRYNHDISLLTNWKVFPKTALVSNIIFSPTYYFGDGTPNVNSLPIRSYFGLQGLVTSRFALRLLAGYGGSFYESGPNFDSVVAEVEFGFFITPTAKIAIGGKRDFVDSMYANFYERDGGYLSYEQMFGGRFLITLMSDVYYRKYATYNSGATDPVTGSTLTPNTTNREDVWISSGLLLEYRITEWLSVHASGRIWADVTDFSYDYEYNDPDGNALSSTLDASFFKFEAFGGVQVHY